MKTRTPWLDRPFSFTPFFRYATGVPQAPRHAAGKKRPPKGPRPGEPPVTTMAVGEEGQPPPPAPGPTTPARGEEGVGDIPTTTIAKGEEAAD
jgi:hypothetical protein